MVWSCLGALAIYNFLVLVLKHLPTLGFRQVPLPVSQCSTVQVQLPKSTKSLFRTRRSVMAGPRERSRHRGMERQKEYEMHDIQTSHSSPTAEEFIAHDDDQFDDRNHGHPQDSGNQRLHHKIARTCTERLMGVLRMCKERLAKYRMVTILATSIICTLVFGGIWAACGLNRNAMPFDYGSDMDNERAMGHHTITVTHSSTVYLTVSLHYQQFHGARPVHHQAPMAVPSNLEATGQRTGQGVSHPPVVTATSAQVSGLYLIPMSLTDGIWPQTQQESRPSCRPPSNIEETIEMLGNPSSVKSVVEPNPLLQSRKVAAPHDLFAGQADLGTDSSTRWLVELLYDLHRRSPRDMAFYEGWCINNTCSPQKQLSSMCNTSKAISDSFQKQECEWCWPEKEKKHQEIRDHCVQVSRRALNATFIICGIFLFCTLVIAIVLATQMLRRRRRAEADRSLHKHASTASSSQEYCNSGRSHWFWHKAPKTRVGDTMIRKRSPGEAVGQTSWYKRVFAKSGKRLEIGSENPAPSQMRLQKQGKRSLNQEVAIGNRKSREGVPVLPPASPAISSRIFSDIENMGQGTLLLGPDTNNSQHDPQGMPRRSSRQSRAVSSGSEQNPSLAAHRRDTGTGL